jgi:hypothetical protein
MKASLKVSSGGKIQNGMMKSLGAIYDTVTAVSLQNTLPREMFTNGFPYEASRTYKTMKSEIECTRSMALMEMHRQTLRGL